MFFYMVYDGRGKLLGSGYIYGMHDEEAHSMMTDTWSRHHRGEDIHVEQVDHQTYRDHVSGLNQYRKEETNG